MRVVAARRRELREVLEKSVEEKSGEEQEIAGAHIDVADGSLELRIQSKASSARIEPQRVYTISLQQYDDKEVDNSDSSGKQDGFQVNTGKEKTSKEKEIAKL